LKLLDDIFTLIKIFGFKSRKSEAECGCKDGKSLAIWTNEYQIDDKNKIIITHEKQLK